MRALLLTLLVAALVGAAALSRAPEPSAALRPEEPSARLRAALEAVDARAIRADARFLSDDALEGRDTPSRGLRVAARYFETRLRRLGWQPGAGGDFFHEFQLEHRAVDVERSVVEVEREDGDTLSLRFGRDYLFTNGEVWEHAVRAGAVGAGSGEREELEGLDLSGKWAVCRDITRQSGLRRRLLLKAGARGVLVLPDPALGDHPRLERLRRSAGWAMRGSIEYPGSGPPFETGATSRYFHQLHLTEAGAARLAEFLGLADPLELTAVGSVHDFALTDHRKLPGERGMIEVENVCALWPGSDPELSDEVILVSAHYDHDGIKAGAIYNGADDNASGSSGLLALADALAAAGPLERSVMLIWVSAEEKGLFGSQAWVEAPTLPPGMRALCNLNVDMIGRNAPGELYVTPSPAHRRYNGLVALARRFAPLEGFEELGSADRYFDRSDHANFARLDIPVAFLFNGEHEDYHRPTDTFEKLDVDKIRRVVRLIVRVLDALQTDPLDLTSP